MVYACVCACVAIPWGGRILLATLRPPESGDFGPSYDGCLPAHRIHRTQMHEKRREIFHDDAFSTFDQKMAGHH
jgi:hypothetical protein